MCLTHLRQAWMPLHLGVIDEDLSPLGHELDGVFVVQMLVDGRDQHAV